MSLNNLGLWQEQPGADCDKCDAQVQGIPGLMDRVLKSHGGEIFLERFINPQTVEGIPATDLLIGGFSPPLPMWLNEIVTPACGKWPSW